MSNIRVFVNTYRITILISDAGPERPVRVESTTMWGLTAANRAADKERRV